MTVDNDYFGAILVRIEIDECHNNSVFEVLFDGFFADNSCDGDDVSKGLGDSFLGGRDYKSL